MGRHNAMPLRMRRMPAHFFRPEWQDGKAVRLLMFTDCRRGGWPVPLFPSDITSRAHSSGRIPGSVYTSDMCGRLHGWKQKPPRRLQEMRSSFPLLNGAKDPRDGASFHYMRSLHGKCRCRGCDEVMLSLEKQSTGPAVIKKAAGRFSRDSFQG